MPSFISSIAASRTSSTPPDKSKTPPGSPWWSKMPWRKKSTGDVLPQRSPELCKSPLKLYFKLHAIFIICRPEARVIRQNINPKWWYFPRTVARVKHDILYRKFQYAILVWAILSQKCKKITTFFIAFNRGACSSRSRDIARDKFNITVW